MPRNKACNLYNILVGRRPTYPIMQPNFYSVNRLLPILQRKQCDDIYMQFTLHKRNSGVMIYFRKA
jgi:hypothetical protein